jgi:hypothetical protein
MCGRLAIVHMALARMPERKIRSLLVDHRHRGDNFGLLAVNEIHGGRGNPDGTQPA